MFTVECVVSSVKVDDLFGTCVSCKPNDILLHSTLFATYTSIYFRGPVKTPSTHMRFLDSLVFGNLDVSTTSEVASAFMVKPVIVT